MLHQICHNIYNRNEIASFILTVIYLLKLLPNKLHMRDPYPQSVWCP